LVEVEVYFSFREILKGEIILEFKKVNLIVLSFYLLFYFIPFIDLAERL